MAEDGIGGNPYKELLRRFAITFFLGVIVYRFGTLVPVPGLNVQALQEAMKAGAEEGGQALKSILAMANMFNGGAIANGSIFGLGIMPYISASIIIQLLAFSFPALKQLQKEGEVGRRKINQYTRYTTVAICLAQSALAAVALSRMELGGQSFLMAGVSPLYFVLQTMVVVTTGSMVLLWLAEQITRHGVGNGVSVVIMIGILASFPGAFAELISQETGTGEALPTVLLMIGIFLVMIAAMVLITQARRFINMESQRRVQGNKVYGGNQTRLPLMLNQAGVIPVIFASPVMVVLGIVLQYIYIGPLVEYGSPLYRYLFAALIIFFTYFYISITVDLNDWANNFKQSGFFIRGVRPGRNTAEYLKFRLMRITFVGSLSLALITVLPGILSGVLRVSDYVSEIILGGVGLLIVVGVSLDVIQKVSAFLLAHQYQGLMLRRGGEGPSGGGGTGGFSKLRPAGRRF